MATSAGSVELQVLPNLAAFAPALIAGLQKSMGSMQSIVTTAFSKFGVLAGAAIAAGVAASVSSAVDYERAFTRIDAITNASTDQIREWRTEVLSMAGATAQAPVALADALYYLASAGLKADQIMPTLEASAQAASMGMGEVSDVAKITAQALNAYSESGLTTTQVMDALTAAVREGTAEPEEYAVALGRVLPIANQAGVAFNEVVASLSSMSNVGLDVDEGVTALRQLLITIAAPTIRAANAMASLGISTGELRTVLKEGGVIAAMNMLMKASGGNLDVLRVLIPNVRALAGGLNLAGDQMRDNKIIMDAVTNSAGDFAEAWAVTTANVSFQVRRLWNQFKVIAVVIGENLLPVFEAAVAVFEGLVAVLISAEGALDDVVYAIIGLKVVSTVAPLVVHFAQALTLIATSGAASYNIITNLAAGATALASKFVPVAVAIAGVYTAHKLLTRADPTFVPELSMAVQQAAVHTESLRDELEALGPAIKSSSRYVPVIAGIRQELEYLGDTSGGVTKWLGAMETFIRSFGKEGTKNHFRVQALSVKEFLPALEEVESALMLAGYSAASFGAEAVEAADKGTYAFKTFSAEALGAIGDALGQMQTEISSGVNFVGSALEEMAGKAHATASDYLAAFGKARRATTEFGKDLLEISRHGGEALTMQLVSMGEEGARAADVIAGASDKMRDKLIEGFNAGQTAADKLATQLTRQIGGTLKSIERILKAIAKEWELDIKAPNLPKTKDDAEGLGKKLQDMVAHPWLFKVRAEGVEAANNQVENLEGNLIELASKAYIANVYVHTPKQSPNAFEMIDLVRAGLESLTASDWIAEVFVTVRPSIEELARAFVNFQASLKKLRLGVNFAAQVQEGMSGLVDAIRAFYEEQKQLEKDLAQARKDEDKEEIAKLEKQLEKFGDGLSKIWLEQAKHFRSWAAELERKLAKLQEKVQDFADTIRSAFDIDLVGEAFSAFQENADERARLLEEQKNLQEELAKTTDSDEIADLTEQLAEVTTALNALPNAAASIAQAVALQVQQAVDFGKALQALAAAGLSQANIAQLAEQGVSALPFAQELLNNPALIEQLNQAAEAIAQAAGQTTSALVDKYFGKALQRAAERVERFQERLAEFIKNLRTEAMAAGIREVIRELDHLAKRLANVSGGVYGSPPAADEPEKATTARPPTVEVRGGKPGRTALVDPVRPREEVNITVNGWVGSDQQIASRVRDELVRLQRANNNRTGIKE